MSGLDHDALYARIERDIARERGPVAWLRARRTETRIALLGLGALGGIGAALWFAGYAPVVPAVVTIAGLLVLFVLAATLATWPLHRRALSFGLRAASLLGTLAAILLLIMLDTAGPPGSFGGGCLAVGLIAGAPVFVMGLLVMRRPRHGLLFASAAGGAASAIAVHLFCGGAGWLHSLTAHFGATMGIIALGAVATTGAMLLSRRRAQPP